MAAVHCSYCTFCCLTRFDLIKHTFASHSVELNLKFVCGIKGRLHSFRPGATFSSFKTHCSRKHPNWQDCLKERVSSPPALPHVGSLDLTSPEMSPDPGLDPDHDPDPSTQDSDSIHEPTEAASFLSIQRTSAMFLLSCQERFKLPQTAINFAIGSVNSIISSVCDLAQASVQGTTDPDTDVSTILEQCRDPFIGLQTEYMQNKYYREHFGLVEPVTVELGTSYKYRRSGSKRLLVEKSDTYQYVPLLNNLEWILQNNSLSSEVFKERPVNHSPYLYDFCDGQVYKEHPLFATDKSAYQLIIYFDEVEVVNPLGSYRGHHKLGMFYYQLGNIKPQLRSILKTIQVIACVTNENLLKYGYEMVLRKFIEDANMLSEGVTMKIRGKDMHIKGGVLFALSDTLAAHSLGGFKVGVGFSLRKCRMCLATQEEIRTKFTAKEFIPRTIHSYNYHCSLLDGPLWSEHSTTYGVNCSSVLNDLYGFHVVDQLPQDIMHCLLEGVVPHELTLLLTDYITIRKLFTCEQINDRIACFSYSTHEAKDKPSPIRIQSLASRGCKITQSYAQIWTLAANLPLIIRDKIPVGNLKWECFLLLLSILQLCTTRVASASQAGILGVLIKEHHILFTKCYPAASIIPKMHYMVHLPQQLLRTGPLLCTWCMRMEGKNSYFKRIAQISNFKNVAYSVTKRHQRLLCSYLQCSDFFGRGLECGPAKEPLSLASEEDLVVKKVEERFTVAVPSEEYVLRSTWVSIEGYKYTRSDYLLIRWQPDDLPCFARVEDIAVFQQKIIFLLLLCTTVGIDDHYHSYVIRKTTERIALWYEQIVDKEPHVAHVLQNGEMYVTVRSHTENTACTF